jgi:hypothetical protein
VVRAGRSGPAGAVLLARAPLCRRFFCSGENERRFFFPFAPGQSEVPGGKGENPEKRAGCGPVFCPFRAIMAERAGTTFFFTLPYAKLKETESENLTIVGNIFSMSKFRRKKLPKIVPNKVL